MYLLPLNQIESVELVVHALRVAGGEADCSSCPVRKVCMKQCLTIAGAVATMLADGLLPSLDPAEPDIAEAEAEAESTGSAEPAAPVTHLKVIK